MSALFDAARELFLEGDLDWVAHTFKVYGIDEGTDTPNVSSDDFADDLASGAKVFTSSALANTSTPLGTGVADADDRDVTSVSGATVESLVIWRDTGTQSSSPLVVYINSATGLPFTPNGGTVNIVWASTSNRIFKL
jgi:hypothetical protein